MRKTLFIAGLLFAVLWSSLAGAQTSIVGTPAYAITSSGVSTISVNSSTGVTTGDVIFAYVSTLSAANVTVATPTGWTVAAGPTSIGTGQQSYVFQRVSDGTDGATYTFNFSGNVTTSSRAMQITYRGVNNIAPVDGSITNAQQASGTSLVLPAVSPVGPAGLLVAFIQDYGGFSGQAISGMTNELATGSLGLYDQQLSASGTTGTRTATGLNSSASTGFLFAVAPASPSIVGYTGAPTGLAGASSISLPYSPGSQSGDIVFAYIGTSSAANITVTTPSGWTLIGGPVNPATGFESYLFQHISAGLDPSNFVFSFSGAVTNYAFAQQITYRGINNSTPIDGSVTTVSQTSGTTAVLPAVSPAGSADLLVAFVQDYGGFSGFASAISGMALESTTVFDIFDQPLASSGSTGTRTATGLNSSISTGFLFAVLPTTLPTPTPTATPTPVPAIAASCPAGQFVTQISPTICQSNGVVAETIYVDEAISNLAPIGMAPSVAGTTNTWQCPQTGVNLQWDLTNVLPTNTLYLREVEISVSLSRGGIADIAFGLFDRNTGASIANYGEDHYLDRTGGMPSQTDKEVYYSYITIPQAASGRVMLNGFCRGIFLGNLPVITMNLNLKANIGN